MVKILMFEGGNYTGKLGAIGAREKIGIFDENSWNLFENSKI